jgi:chromosomal replication initiator protein
MIDDIQFLTRKEKTQEELFHNINDLVNANKQIIITSDRPPREIATLEDRLRSRFEGGLIADITPPDLETRVAILALKAESYNITLDPEMLFYIAERASDNVRELEGSLKRVVAYATTMNRSINMDLITEALKDYHTSAQRRITADKILSEVAAYFETTTAELIGKKRDASIVLPRHIAMYLCREHTDLSYPRIADEFGGKDHSTIIHGIGKIRQALKEEGKTKTYVEDIERRLQGT